MRRIAPIAACFALAFTPEASAGEADPAALATPCRPWIDDYPLPRSGEAHRVGDTVCFAGQIDAESSARLVAAVTGGPADRPMTLILRSLGGDVIAALDAADVLVQRDVTGVVYSICASSCANYLLMAADRRIIAEDSILVWHGGWSVGFLADRRRKLAREERRRRPDLDEIARLRTLIDRIVEDGSARQTALLTATGADPRFFEVFDDINARPRRDWSADCADRPQVAHIVFSDAFLARYGIVIHENHGPADTASLRALLDRREASDLACFWG